MTYEVIAFITPDPSKIDTVREGLAEIAKGVQDHEPGCLRYQFFEKANADGSPEFFVIEEYTDEAAYKAHFTTDQFKALGERIKNEGLLAKPLNIVPVNRVAGFWNR